VLDGVSGMGTFNHNFEVKGVLACKGAWVGLWVSLLLRRGATKI
jgi:hypothetical protein